ncbi:hypothetical protein ANCCEY_13956 [Ancylostoma ceylanicum]|uniref:Uncharacterized protein n=1 Tax=Ancylostoma ceylanicum TaxID=53326 RepID=A0A0D6L7M9_9BILA|nr:hypothetical protein ANCCEY_13956 [Ancylostoma ceylanicum]
MPHKTEQNQFDKVDNYSPKDLNHSLDINETNHIVVQDYVNNTDNYSDYNHSLAIDDTYNYSPKDFNHSIAIDDTYNYSPKDFNHSLAIDDTYNYSPKDFNQNHVIDNTDHNIVQHHVDDTKNN